MTTLEKIRAEIEQIQPYDLPWDKRTPEHIRDMAIAIIDKYAEQEIDIAYIGEFCHKHGLVLMSKEMADKYAEQEPCDAISRQAVLKIIDGWYEQNRDTENIEDLIVLITYMDSVRPQEQTGHWTNKEFRKEEYVLMGKCSVCGRGRVIDGLCSYCGCRMFEPQERSDNNG